MRSKRFAFRPYRRWIKTSSGFTHRGWYWLERVNAMHTLWNGWTTFADDNDECPTHPTIPADILEDATKSGFKVNVNDVGIAISICVAANDDVSKLLISFDQIRKNRAKNEDQQKQL